MKLSITENSALVPLCEDSHNGTIMVAWDNGCGLSVAYGEDACRVVSEDD